MKRLLILSLLSVQLCVYSAVFAADEEITRTVRVGVYDNAPKIYRNDDGVISGFWADVTNDIARREGWSVAYIHDTWENNLARLASGQIDLMVDVAISDLREQVYDFNNETVLLSWGLFYTREGITLDSIAELQGKRIAVLKTGILYTGPLGLKDILETAGIEAEVIDVTEYSDVFSLLDQGAADVGVVSWYFGFANEAQYRVKRTGILFRPSELRYALPPGAPANPELVAAIDNHLVQMKADPESVYHQSIVEHFGAFVEKETVLPTVVRYIIGALGLLVLVFVVITLTLRRYKHSLERQVQKQMTELQETARQLSIVYDNVADVVFYLTVESPGRYRFTRVNTAFSRVTGVPLDQIVGKLATDVIPKASQDLVLGNYERAIRERTRVQWSEMSEYPTGTKYGEVAVSPVFDGDRCVALIGTVHDVTDRKEQERKLAEAAEKIADLQRAKSEFVSIAAHQLKSPISVILGYASIFRDGALTDTQREAVDALDKGVREMNELINFLLKITRAEAGSMKLELASINLKELTESVVEILSGELNAKNQRVQIQQDAYPFKDPSQFPAVVLDREALKQVILNLLSNAQRYSPENSVIQVSMKIKGDAVVYEVSDHGIGIPKDAQDKLFDAFFRAENARAMVPEGTGLGLPLAKSFVEAWGGSLQFVSEENKGSTFSFTIPMIGESEHGSPRADA